MKILITGGAGFIGANFIHYCLRKYPADRIVNFDKLTYAGNLENLQKIENDERYLFVRGDVCDKEALRSAAADADAIVHFAAESHVDRSIHSSREFLETNILGTGNVIDVVRELGIKRFVHIGTDEVYGDILAPKKSKFGDLMQPSSPYSASKAGADLLVLAAVRTYGLPAMITHCTNNYGPYQFPEKLIPVFVTNALENKKLPLYDNGTQIRDWLFVEDHCRAIDLVLRKGKAGAVYDIAAENVPEITNRLLTEMILDILEKPRGLIEAVSGLRPGHDQRYAVDASKIREELGWQPEVGLEEGLRRTIEWYKSNEAWWRRVKDGKYKEYYAKQYKEKESPHEA